MNPTEKEEASLMDMMSGVKPFWFLDYDPKTKQLKMEKITTEFMGNSAVTKNADSSEVYLGDG